MHLEKQTVEKVKEIWNTWDIRVFMVISFVIQVLLTFLAPYRKRCGKNGFFRFCIWMLYLSADAVALFTIGLISNANQDSRPGTQLAAFWAPFLLLHLGGPDTISALALEDNELWLRHGLQLATQAAVTLYVFAQSVRTNQYLWLPTLLMFVDGCIKYIERTCALYFASTDIFMHKLSKEGESIFDGHLVVFTPIHMIKEAFKAYKWYKALLVDNAVNLHALKYSRDFFLRIKLDQVIEVVEIQLNLIYEAFFTKKPLLMMSKIGFVLARVVSFLSVVTSIVLFTLKDKSKYHKIDVVITFVLLVGAIALDLYASVKLVTSTWFIIKTCYQSDFLETHCKKLLEFLCLRVVSSSRRWSKSILQYNLLTCCQGDHLPLYLEYVFIERVKDVLIGWFYVQAHPIDDGKLVEFITDRIISKAKEANNESTTKEVDSASGVQIFQTEFTLVPDDLRPWITDLTYDESLLTMHLATDLCYRIDDSYDTFKDHTNGSGEALYYQFSKQLSDYMLYIILRQQPMVLSVAGFSDIQFEQTVKCGRKLMRRFQLEEGVYQPGRELEQFCNHLMSKVDREEYELKEEYEKKVVFYNACKLAEKLRSFKGNQWEIISNIWVDILCYGASRSQPKYHIARVNEGGELITIAWLLMAHLGLAGLFQESNRAFETELLIWKSA